MTVTAQFALYPLRTTDISPAISAAIAAVRAHRVAAETGLMSTLLEGDEAEVFAALRAAFNAAAEQGDTVLTVTISNACK